MKKLILSLILTIIASGAWLGLTPAKASAAVPYDPANLISDSEFTDSSTMSATDIQNFLNAEGSGIRNYSDVENCSPPTPTQPYSYTYYPHCGTTQSAATLIYDAAQAYHINPRSILATMQKEQSLVTDPTPASSNMGAVNCAMGYLSCGSGVSGFFSQVDNGTWQLRLNIELMNGRSWWGYASSQYICRNAGTIQAYNSSGQLVTMRVYSAGLYPNATVTFDNPTVYDSTGTTITGGKNPAVPQTITLANSATATLYCYTPYVGPFSSTGYSGSYNFVTWYETWWPSYLGEPVWQSVFTDSSKSTSLGWNASLTPVQSAWVVVVMKNTGSATWTKNGGGTDVRLVTASTYGHQSVFCNGNSNWIATNPICTRPAVFDEASVAPGATGTFEFRIDAPSVPGLYNEFFGLIIDGKTILGGGTAVIQFNVQPPTYTAQHVWQSVFSDQAHTNSLGWNATVSPTQPAYVIVVMRNTGNIIWTKNGGANDVRLVTYNTWGHQSTFCNGNSNWIATNPICTRPAVFDEASVPPGSNGTFEFRVDPPPTPGNYTEYYSLIIDGKTLFSSGVATINFNVGYNYTAQPVWQAVYTDSSKTTQLGWNGTMSPVGNAWVVIVMKNTSNFTWTKNGGANDVRLVTYNTWGHQSTFCNGNSNWIATNPICTRPAVFDEASVPPGSNGTFEFRVDAPQATGNYNEAYGLIIDGRSVFSTGVAVVGFTVH